MNSLNKIPCIHIESMSKQFCDELWKQALNQGNNCRELATAISEFQEALKNFIINELYASSIVEEYTNKIGDSE